MGVTQTATQPALLDEVVGARPTAELPLRHLLNLSIYWLGINVIWSGLGNLIYQERLRATVGEALAPAYLGILVTVPVFISVLVQPTVAAISDYTVSRWGRRKPYIFIGTVLDIVFLWGLAEANVFVAILAFVILLQCSSNFAQGPFQGYVPDLVPARQVGLASGLMGVMIVIGQMVGLAIAGLGLLQIGEAPFALGTAEAGEAARRAFFLPTLALGAIEFVTMLLLVATIDEGRQAPPRNGRSWRRIALGAWGTDILQERSYVWLLVSRLLFLMAPALLTGLGPFYLAQSLGFQEEASRFLPLLIIGAIFGGTTALTALPAARMSDRIGRKRIIYTSIVIGALGMAGVAVAPSFEFTVLALIPVGISAGAFLAVDWALMTDIIPKATSGRYMGISNVATAISGPLGLGIGSVVVTSLVVFGLPPELRALERPPAHESAYYEAAPRIAMALTLVFLAISAWTLRRVDERRRED
ncbi:MAG TPA: MFS transporter [Candidatus Caenarcaniphilales bacterium]|nr:MFS transporter [Candidatus Caenarcaniphilales bacterium]